MTENLERLLDVAKEKERLQAEIEVARAVQEQLYPRFMPSIKTLRIAAVCEPARMVSGDFYDYQSLGVQHYSWRSAMSPGKAFRSFADGFHPVRHAHGAAFVHGRFQLRAERRPPVLGAHHVRDESADARDLGAEKFATCYFGLYDDSNGTLRYTNAGHLPPILVRKGAATRLEVNGTVMGAFPSLNTTRASSSSNPATCWSASQTASPSLKTNTTKCSERSGWWSW